MPTATRNGYGKRTPLKADYTRHRRGGRRRISIQVSARNGPAVGACIVAPEDRQAMLITASGGTPIRTRVKEISVVGRNTQGVHLIDLGDSSSSSALERIVETDEE